LLPFFIAAVLWHDVWPFRLLNTAPLRLIGVLSYSIYLMHTTALWMLERQTGWSLFVRGLSAFAISVALALLIQRYIEAPLARVRRALSRVASAPVVAVSNAESRVR
jgi:peptidoglycan/LPS O-acetylase OafA/YrhL